MQTFIGWRWRVKRGTNMLHTENYSIVISDTIRLDAVNCSRIEQCCFDYLYK